MSDWMNQTDKEMLGAAIKSIGSDDPLPPWGWGVILGDTEETTRIVPIEPEQASEYYMATFDYHSMDKDHLENWVTNYFENPDSFDVMPDGEEPVEIPVQTSPYSTLHYRTVMGNPQSLLDEIDAADGEILAIDTQTSIHPQVLTTVIWKTISLPDKMQAYIVLEDLKPHALHHALNQYHDKGYEVMSLDTGPEGSHGEIYYTVVLKHKAI